MTIVGIGPRSTTPDSETVILLVGGLGGFGGGAGPMKANAGGKQPLVIEDPEVLAGNWTWRSDDNGQLVFQARER